MHEAAAPSNLHEYAGFITVGFGFLSTVILSLIGWGMRGQMTAMRAEFGTHIERLRNEFNSALASAESRFFERVNGKYVRSEILRSELNTVDLKLANVQCRECRTRVEAK